MNYETLSKEELLKKIYYLESLNNELLKEKEQCTTLNYSWAGNLGNWYWNVKENVVKFNPLKITSLGYTKDEIPDDINYQFFTDKLHPDDYERTINNMKNHLLGNTPVYEVEYRIKCKNGCYKWYYDIGKIAQYDNDDKPLLVAGIVFDITEKKILEMDLEYKNKILSEKALIDELTNMHNFRAIKEYLDIQINESKIKESPLSLALFDIDNFKCLNDTKGHVFGNEVLIKIANIISNNIRKNDIAGRFGGEEFIVIFPNTTLKNASKIAERIRYSIESNSFSGSNITISGGVSEYCDCEILEFLDYADKKLYEAKKTGKNKIVY